MPGPQSQVECNARFSAAAESPSKGTPLERQLREVASVSSKPAIVSQAPRGSDRAPGSREAVGGSREVPTPKLKYPRGLAGPEFPMPSNKSGSPWIASVPIVVSDRAKSTKWYVEKLGMRLIDSDDHWVTVGGEGKGTVFHLCQASENQPAPIPLEPGPSGIVIAIPGDFEKECHRLKAAGITFSHDAEKAPWGWYAIVRDPDGNEHNLCPAP